MTAVFGSHVPRIAYRPIAELFALYRDRDPSKTAIVDLDSGTSITFGVLDRVTTDIAALLKSRGVVHGSRVLLRKAEAQYDATDRAVALQTIQQRLKHGEYLTGLLYIGSDQPELHALSATPDLPLNQIPYAKLNPGPQALAKTLAKFR